jgi:ABC-type transport system involved in cytochrome c biogenesis permease subunit
MLIVVFFFFPLVGIVGDLPTHCELDIGVPHLASLMLITTCNPFGCNLHVDRHFPYFPFWLQLLGTLLVVVILILVV